MMFGWSAGDIAECVKLLIKIGNALRDSGGSAVEYQNAVDFLKGVETTVQGVENILQNHPDLTFQTAFVDHATKLMTAVTHFRKKTEGYDTSLGANATTSETKKAWKKIKLALFAHIEELKAAVSYPQSVVNNLICLQALDILVNLSKKPTLSPQQFQDSTEEISRNFPILGSRIETLRSDMAEDFIAIQQTTESNFQRNFDQIQRDLSEGNTLQRSFSVQAQAEAEAQDLWRNQFQICIAEIQAGAQKHFEALQEMKQAQETNHQYSMQTALQVYSWRYASRPVVKVIRKTVIANSRPTRSAPATGDGSSRGGTTQAGNSKGDVSRGAGSRGGVSQGESPRGASRRGSSSRGGNARGAKSSRGSPLGASHSRGNLKGSSSRGGSARGGSSKGSSSQGGNSRGGHSQGVNSQANNSQRDFSKNNHIRGGSMRRGSARGDTVTGSSLRGGNVQRGGMRGGSVRGSNIRGSSVRGNGVRGSSIQGSVQSASIRRGNVAGTNVRGGSVRANTRGGTVRGNARGGVVRGTMRGSVRGHSLRGTNVRRSKV